MELKAASVFHCHKLKLCNDRYMFGRHEQTIDSIVLPRAQSLNVRSYTHTPTAPEKKQGPSVTQLTFWTLISLMNIPIKTLGKFKVQIKVPDGKL